MVVWSVAQREAAAPPSFSLTGVLLYWPDGAIARVKQTPFTWEDGAWQACVEVSPLGGAPRNLQATIRLEPAVAEAWRRRHVNPRNEAAAQLRSAMGLQRRAKPAVVNFIAVEATRDASIEAV